uniref:Uncharacterized protein n=1 Tax=Arundo donax TaxID=35708 RepID=A0A0A9AUH5_ARUDO
MIIIKRLSSFIIAGYDQKSYNAILSILVARELSKK